MVGSLDKPDIQSGPGQQGDQLFEQCRLSGTAESRKSYNGGGGHYKSTNDENPENTSNYVLILNGFYGEGQVKSSIGISFNQNQ